MTTFLTDSPSAYKLLNGLVCIYKPLGYGTLRIMREFKHKILQDLNSMSPPPRTQRVEVHRVDLQNPNRIPLENERILASFPDGNTKQVEVVQGLSYQDHPLVIGKRWLPQDIKMLGTGPTSREISGVHLYGINYSGMWTARRIFHSRWLRTYLVSGRFGIATDNYFHTGRIIEKSTFKNVKEHLLDRFLLASQASHQRTAFEATGVPINSEAAYLMASQGLVRPDNHSHPIIYSLKLVHFKLPDFTVEMKVINPDFGYLKELVHQIGLKMHSNAVTTKIVCTGVGPFGVGDSLIMRHWGVGEVLGNMKRCQEKVEMVGGLEERRLWVGNEEEGMEGQLENEEEEEEEEEITSRTSKRRRNNNFQRK